MIDKRLLVLVLFVEQKFIWIVVRAIDDELQIPRLLPGRRSEIAQDRFDFFGLPFARAPVSNNHICHDLPVGWWKTRKLPR